MFIQYLLKRRFYILIRNTQGLQKGVPVVPQGVFVALVLMLIYLRSYFLKQFGLLSSYFYQEGVFRGNELLVSQVLFIFFCLLSKRIR